MAGTTLQYILGQVRAQLVETVARFWSDQELLDIMNLAITDLWGAILDLHQDHYWKINGNDAGTGDVYYRANDTQLSGIPQDCFRIQLIEPRDTTVTGTGHACIFVPRKFNHPDFSIARTLDPQDPDSLPSRQIYYAIVGEGSPANPPQVLCAPKISADLPIRLCYSPSIDRKTAGDMNPIPGGSDNALKAWTLSYAMAKEVDAAGNRIPNSGWLAVYAQEKQNLLVRLTPREEQEPEVVEDMFQGYGSLW